MRDTILDSEEKIKINNKKTDDINFNKRHSALFIVYSEQDFVGTCK